jgi:cytochrome P450
MPVGSPAPRVLTRFANVKFNGGPRICIGQQFSLTEAGYVAVRILQRFSAMENLDPCWEPRHSSTITTSSANGVKVRLRECE